MATCALCPNVRDELSLVNFPITQLALRICDECIKIIGCDESNIEHPRKTAKCKHCGVRYDPIDSEADDDELFCTPKCEGEFNIGYDATCMECGAAFAVDDSDADEEERYCSRECEKDSERDDDEKRANGPRR